MSTHVHPGAGHPVAPGDLVDIPRLITAYFTDRPDVSVPAQRVAFGTSGHRGSAFSHSFNEDHILAIAQAICLFRTSQGIDGPMFLGRDTHALSEPAFVTVIEVLAANGVDTRIDAHDRPTPTPAISHAILVHNRGRTAGLADGIVLTPSHNPPADGGLKYNPPSGGPAGSDATRWIEQTANTLLEQGLADVRRIPYSEARKSSFLQLHDYVEHYVADLATVIDMEAIRSSGVAIGIDPLGGSSLPYWQPVIEHYGIKAQIVSDRIDPTFGFMTADWDGKIRMDCSSPYAMARLIGMRDRFDVAFANDPDADRHGIVCRSAGLMNPNHFLTAAIDYLFTHRPGWPAGTGVGKTLVSSSTIDRVAARLGRRLFEVPVGFKWFVDGLLDGSLGFVGEESAGASFLRRDGLVWTTDKDGLILGLLAAEMTARTGRDPGELYRRVIQDLGVEEGAPYYERIDAPATALQKRTLAALSPDQVDAGNLAGTAVEAVLTTAPGNGEKFGGIKVVAADGWFAARPSGTEDVYKIYAESFRSETHLRTIQDEARQVVERSLGK